MRQTDDIAIDGGRINEFIVVNYAITVRKVSEDASQNLNLNYIPKLLIYTDINVRFAVTTLFHIFGLSIPLHRIALESRMVK